MSQRKTITLGEVLEKYLQKLRADGASEAHLRTVAWRLGRFVTPRADWGIGLVSRLDLAEHLAEMRRTRSDGTMAGLTSTHRAFWRWVRRKGWTKKNLARRLKRYSYEPAVRQAASAASVEAVARALPAFVEHRGRRPRDVRDALLVSLSLDSGARLGEMAELRWPHVQQALNQGVVAAGGRVVYQVVARGKTGMSTLEFFQETADLFRLWFVVAPAPTGDYVFISLARHGPQGGLLRRDSLARAFERVCRFAGVPVFRAHAVRRRNISDLIAEADPETAQRYAGHSELETTLKHYKEKADRQVRDAAAGLAARRREDSFNEEMARLFGLEKSGTE